MASSVRLMPWGGLFWWSWVVRVVMSGQQGPTDNRLVPVAVAGNKVFTRFDSGANHNVGLARDAS